ncbi:MAG: hypothetical protein QXW10_00615 [Candidatus Micrarchaeaceae archaeon]
MDSKRKKTMLFLGSLVVAVMFLTGAAGLGGGGGVPSGNTSTAAHTLSIKNTFLAGGVTNATIYNYGSDIKLALYNSTDANRTIALLTSMEGNGSISTYTQVSSVFNVYASKYNAYQVYVELLKSLGNKTFSFSAPEYVRLPVYTTLSVGNQSIEVNTSLAQDYSLYTNLTGPNSTIRIKVLAMVGTLNNSYVLVPNNVTITRVG